MPPTPEEEFRRKLQAAIKASIAKAGQISSVPNEGFRAELDFVDTEKKKEEIRSLKQDTDERKCYAHRFFCLCCAWLMVICVVLLSQGFNWHYFYLEQKIMLAAIGATTVNVLGILYVVANYLFPKR